MAEKTKSRAKIKKRKRRTKLILSSLGFILLTGFIVAGSYLGWMYISAKNTVQKTYKDSNVTTVNKIETLKASNSDTKISILLMGLDNDSERNIEGTRSDSIIYMVYDGSNKNIEMVSIPRDIWTDIYDGEGNIVDQNKINSAYNWNEEDSMIETVKNYLDLPVDYFATVNFISFKEIIDAVGGIDVDVPYDINSEYTKDNSGSLLIPEGKQHLNGEQALVFSRIRKVDSDIDRGNRQQEVIKATIDQTLKINSLTKYKDILNTVEDNVSTNLTFDNLVGLAGGMLGGFNINSNTFDWEGGYIGDQSVVYIKEDSFKDIRNKMLTSLDLATTYTNE